MESIAPSKQNKIINHKMKLFLLHNSYTKMNGILCLCSLFCATFEHILYHDIECEYTALL